MGELVIPEARTNLISQAESFPVVTLADANLAAEEIRGINELIGVIKDTFDPMIESAHKAHKEGIAARKKHLGPLESARDIYKRKIEQFHARAREAARLEEERLRKEAIKRAEEELLVKAEMCERDGDEDGRDGYLNEPLPIVMPPTPKPPKVDGVAMVETWNYRITDEAQIPREFMMPNESAIRKYIQAMKEKAAIAGIEIYREMKARVAK